ncbi:MAG: type II secretion system F family protein [Candidatus Omnitrophota bacterium]
MPRFIYKAKLNPTQIKEGVIEAESRQQAVTKLNENGLFPISLEEEFKAVSGQPRRRKKISQQEVCVFSRQLSSLIESGLNLLPALNVVYKQTPNITFKLVILEICEDVKQGGLFSEALAKYPQVFSPLFVSIIKAGELSGSLGLSLSRLAEHLEREEEIRTNVISSLAYPGLIALVGLATVLVLLTFVIPKLVIMFEDMGQVLPLPTRILILLSGFFSNYGWLLLLLLILSVFIIHRRLKTQEGRASFDNLKLKLPVLGNLVRKIEIVRFCRTLSTLLNNGIPILSSLETGSEIITNQVIRKEAKGFCLKVREGQALSKAMEDSRFFNVFVTNIISVGEESGTLNKALSRIADSLEQELNRSIKIFMSVIEPAMILFIGLVVGFIVVAMLLPVFQISLIAR